MDETPYQLAYDASVRAIEDQARVLEDLRSRVATLVAAAALVTGFFGQAALTRADGIEPVSWVGFGIASFIATATAAVIILWPVHLRFSVSATEIFEILRAVDGSRRLDSGDLEALMAKKPDNGTPRPQPQWPDISKPDTRGGG